MIITKERPNSWRDLESKVAKILVECGFVVESPKKIDTVRATYEADVYAIERIEKLEYSLICECKYWGQDIPQGVILGFRAAIADIGCNIGYVITTSRFQSGAIQNTDFTNIQLVTWEEFQEIFFDVWYSNYFFKEMNKQLYFNYEPVVEWFDDLDKKDKKLFNDIKNKLSEILEIQNYFWNPQFKSIAPAMRKHKLPLENNLFDMTEYYGDVPSDVLQEENHLEFLDKFLKYSKPIIKEYIRLEQKYQKL